MKKVVYLLAAVVIAAFASACSSGTQKGSADSAKEEAAFSSEQPLESGEYRANSFTYDEKDAKRMVFDGRMIVAMDPANSGIYIYENGNRTNFKARLSIKKAFEKSDSAYVAVDSKDLPVTLISGEEMDTLLFTKGTKVVKLAFERKPMSVMSPQDAWKKITAQLDK